MSLLVSFPILVLSLFVAARVLDGMKIKGGLLSHAIVGLFFAVLHWALGEALYRALGVLTLGVGFLLATITRLVASAIVLKIVDALSDRVEVKDFKTAFLAALLMSLVSSVTEALLRHFGVI